MSATIGQKHKNGFKIVEILDNHSESLKNNLYVDFRGPEHLFGGMNLENEIDTCQTTVWPYFCLSPCIVPSENKYPKNGLNRNDHAKLCLFSHYYLYGMT